MTRRECYGWVVIGVAGLGLAGCDAAMPDDVWKAQEAQRMNRGAPRDTELPPGLGADLPDRSTPLAPSTPLPATQPMSSTK